MKQFPLIFSLCLVLSLGLKAQNSDKEFEVIDTSIMRCIYKYKFQTDSLDVKSKREYNMILLVGKKYTLYRNSFLYFVDSVRYLHQEGLVGTKEVVATMSSNAPGGPEDLIIKDINNTNIKLKYRTSNIGYISSDKVELDWQLEQGTDSISGYLCNKAKANFRGREYTAWYSPRLSMPYGPYKFGGLPGMIIKIEDQQHSHTFVLTSAVKLKTKIVEWHKKSIELNYKKYTKAVDDYKVKNLDKARQWFANDPEKVLRITSRILNTNNPIELKIQ